MNDCNTIEPLIAGLLDHELTTEEYSEVNTHLQKCPKCRQTFESLRELDPLLCAPSFKEPADEDLEKFWKSPCNRLLRYVSFLLLISGCAVLFIWGIAEMLLNGHFPPLVRWSIASVITGAFLLLLSVLRERFKTRKQDPYQEVQR